nr:hypothetical protein [Urechidicola croceus]
MSSKNKPNNAIKAVMIVKINPMEMDVFELKLKNFAAVRNKNSRTPIPAKEITLKTDETKKIKIYSR